MVRHQSNELTNESITIDVDSVTVDDGSIHFTKLSHNNNSTVNVHLVCISESIAFNLIDLHLNSKDASTFTRAIQSLFLNEMALISFLK